MVSLRVWYSGGPEVEFGLTGPDWAALPLDEGTASVIRGGMVDISVEMHSAALACLVQGWQAVGRTTGEAGRRPPDPDQRRAAWRRARCGRIIPIAGFKYARQVKENAGAMDFGPLTGEQMQAIEEVL